MNNLFLLNECFNCTSINDLENGIIALNEVVSAKKTGRDNFLRDEDFWQHQTTFGYIYEFSYSILRKEFYLLTPKLFNSFSSYPIYISNEADFDILFPNECNGFIGIDFSMLGISNEKQIFDIDTFNTFISSCILTDAYTSIQNFWDYRADLFPSLVFCDRVWEQIKHLGIADDRFKIINEKLLKLDAFTYSWNNGGFDFKKIGLDCSPDTPSRIRKTINLRTFSCPVIGNQVFSLHIKWYLGGEPFRLYFFPNASDKKVYVGYIGPKGDIGF